MRPESELDALLNWMLGNWHVFGVDIQIWMLAFAAIFLVYGAAHLLLQSRKQRL
jgi:ABC-type multidrug transport system permease subunit